VYSRSTALRVGQPKCIVSVIKKGPRSGLVSSKSRQKNKNEAVKIRVCPSHLTDPRILLEASISAPMSLPPS
jgi:hypothetical protein